MKHDGPFSAPFDNNPLSNVTQEIRRAFQNQRTILPDHVAVSNPNYAGGNYPFIHFTRPYLELALSPRDPVVGRDSQFMRINPETEDVIIDHPLLAVDTLTALSDFDIFARLLDKVRKTIDLDTPEVIAKLDQLRQIEATAANIPSVLHRTALSEPIGRSNLLPIFEDNETIKLLAGGDSDRISMLAKRAINEAGSVWRLPSGLLRLATSDLERFPTGVVTEFSAGNVILHFKDVGQPVRRLEVVACRPGYEDREILRRFSREAGNHGTFAVHPHVTMTEDVKLLVTHSSPLYRQYAYIQPDGYTEFKDPLPDGYAVRIPNMEAREEGKQSVHAPQSILFIPK